MLFKHIAPVNPLLYLDGSLIAGKNVILTILQSQLIQFTLQIVLLDVRHEIRHTILVIAEGQQLSGRRIAFNGLGPDFQNDVRNISRLKGLDDRLVIGGIIAKAHVQYNILFRSVRLIHLLLLVDGYQYDHSRGALLVSGVSIFMRG